MKRWLSHVFIGAYLTALLWGIVAHSLSFGANSHPAMYFLVWDMFCGWGSYSNRIELIGEGESGEYYKLAPAPWGTIKPFGKLDRRHYDANVIAVRRLAQNVLNHTQHEPISRVYLIEENWAKKYNLPDRIWSRYYREPKDKLSYYHVRGIYTPDGKVIENNGGWYAKHYSRMVSNNPRLAVDRQRANPIYAVSPQSYSQPARSGYQSDSFNGVPSIPSSTSLLGN